MDTEFSSIRDWANLSDLVLYLILQKFMSSISDCLCFGLVCKQWFSFVSNNYTALRHHVKELPLLMICDSQLRNSTTNTSLYSVTKGKIILDLNLQLPETRGYCCGSFQGWLAFQQDDLLKFTLFNPFTGETIHLPKLEFHAGKVITSNNPSTNPNNFEIMAMSKCKYKLAILKPGCITWTTLEFNSFKPIRDMIYYNERYYIVTFGGWILSMDKTTLESKKIAPLSSTNQWCFYIEYYLVETTTKELVMVQIIHQHHTPTVRISKLVTSATNQEPIFVELDNLGDEALFLCRHSCMSVLASNFSGCKSNIIYYLDLLSSTHFLDIIHLRDGSFHTSPSFQTYLSDDIISWIFPTLK